MIALADSLRRGRGGRGPSGPRVLHVTAASTILSGLTVTAAISPALGHASSRGFRIR